jgi:hypothetical protein
MGLYASLSVDVVVRSLVAAFTEKIVTGRVPIFLATTWWRLRMPTFLHDITRVYLDARSSGKVTSILLILQPKSHNHTS